MTTHITAAQAAELLRNATPGEWTYGDPQWRSNPGRWKRAITAGNAGVIGNVCGEANARLIAAAPALAARVVELEKALMNATDTFADILKASRMLRYTAVISSCELAEQETRALLSPDDTRTTP